MTKFCVDCKWHRNNASSAALYHTPVAHLCIAPQLQTGHVDLVTGNTAQRISQCEMERKYYAVPVMPRCGIAAHWFEPKDDTE